MTRQGTRRFGLRTILVAIGVVALLGFVGFTGYAVVAGSDQLLHPGKSLDCRTPATAYGWDYEAINYDRTTDNALKPVPPTAKEPNWTCEGTPSPAGSEVVSGDGIHLAGWYIPAESLDATGPTILLVHGRSSNKSDYLRYAVPFHRTYNVVIFDMRGAGQSSDAPNTLGVLEYNDVRAALDWLMTAKDPGWIALVGTSMGASTALAVALDDSRVQALVLDSMHARMATGIARGIELDAGLPAFPTQLATFFGAWLRTGVDLSSADPVDLLAQAGARSAQCGGCRTAPPILLTHGSDDEYDRPSESLQLNADAARAAGVHVDVHVCEGAGHDEVIDRCTADWTAWVLSFLDAART